jgi:hypothetical protein
MGQGFIPPTVTSTNAANNLGETLYNAVLKHRPRRAIEFGVLHGYSTLSIGQALRHLGGGHLQSYDLWEDFPFNHGNRAAVEEQIRQAGLDSYVTLGKMDFFDWLDSPQDFDLLYLDIANDGSTIRRAMSGLSKQLAEGAVLIFEGGCAERDQAWWMKEFHREPMCSLRDELGFRILDDRFPCLSVFPPDAFDSRSSPA